MENLLYSLKDIILMSVNISYTDSGWDADFLADNHDRVQRFISLIDNQYFRVKFDKILVVDINEFNFGDTYHYHLTLTIKEVKKNFFSNPDSLISFIFRQFNQIDWNEKLVLPFEKDIYPAVAVYQNYFKLINSLVVLFAQNTYLDKDRNSLVLFTTKPILIPILNNTNFTVFKLLCDKVDEETLNNSISFLKDFLNNESIEAHKDEKKSIFIMETANIVESYEESNRFYKLIENIKKIAESIESSYQAYLNNFSYQKLELELKKDLDYFIKSINDSLGALQTQALGLPIAAALTQMTKDKTGLLPYFALIIFCAFVAFNSFQQYKQVQYIDKSIERFYSKDNVEPVVAKDTLLQEMKKLLLERLNYINLYIKLIWIVSVVIVIFAICMIWLNYSPQGCLAVKHHAVQFLNWSICITY